MLIPEKAIFGKHTAYTKFYKTNQVLLPGNDTLRKQRYQYKINVTKRITYTRKFVWVGSVYLCQKTLPSNTKTIKQKNKMLFQEKPDLENNSSP